jgi:hypothetical protein
MKKVVLLLTVVTITASSFAQGKSGKKDKTSKKETAVVNAVKSKEKGATPKVKEAFGRDYPNAGNVVWSKYKGDYTATFLNGGWKSTAVYHANGDRRDTRTQVTRKDLPGSNWDNIFKRDNIVPASVIQIERPSITEKIFRIVSATKAVTFYDQNGNKVQYDY